MPRTPTRTASPRRRAPRLVAMAALLAVAAFGCVALVDGVEGNSPDHDQESVTELEPALRRAVTAAIRAAEEDGVPMVINSGWRSRAHQQRLFTEAVAAYGSEHEALRWVATPDTSAHVSGDAVDIGPPVAAAWLGRNGNAHGLCQVFANEPWHFELATEPGGRCPAMWPDGRRQS